VTLRAVVGLGANLGDRLGAMRAALGELARATRVEQASRVYASPAVGGPKDQPDFLNAAALILFEGDPLALMALLLEIEASLGRIRRERWGPRTIDLDLLWIEGVTVDDPALVVPHPRLRARDFALAPMLELVPGACDPRTGDLYVTPVGDARPLETLLGSPPASLSSPVGS